MREKLPVMLMALVALALVLSLVSALAPDASAQDSGAAPDGAAKWGRYRMPSAQDMEAAANANFVGVKRDCCIMVKCGGFPNGAVIIDNHFLERPRFYCANHYQNNFY